ncbi:uncharacterized protein K02A2.6-like [Gigantopelta aegis]|uniref:uncharacterized protein K02A2.6-like n=1 Tax=Gigantopelta aegis TaxID=1735272 RepID=UPI001B88BC4B|nr:uncharacterized protein K02A2.6-like [Gigantopelta aegis]
MSKNCNYEQLRDSLIRDRIVVGVGDNHTRKRLLQMRNLNLQQCLDTARACESTNQHLQEMAQGKSEDVQAFQHRTKKKSTVGLQVGQKRVTLINCYYCDKRHPKRKEECPAWGKTCNICKKENHFALKCPTRRFKPRSDRKQKSKEKLYTVEDNSDDSSEGSLMSVDAIAEVAAVNVGGETYPTRIFADMIVNGQKVNFQIDSGASVNVISEAVYSGLSEEKLETGNTTLIMFNKSQIKPVGKCRLRILNPKTKKEYSAEFQVVKEKCRSVLGSRTVQKMKLITVNQNNFESVHGMETMLPLRKKDIETQFTDVFTRGGKLEGELHLKVDPAVVPVQIPPRKLPLAKKTMVKKHIDRLVKKNVLAPVSVPTDWVSSMVVCNKQSGIRLCIDPKPLNKALKRNHYPLPTIDDILPELSTAKLFTVLDAKDGFWHVVLDEESSYLTTFSTPFGRYRWKWMPFGISPAPEEFQRRLQEALEGLEGVAVVTDDILLYALDEADHDRKLVLLLRRCQEKGIRLNKDKMKFKQTEVKYVGHTLTASGLKPDPAKVEAIIKMPPPSDKQGVQRLIGMVNYVAKFAPQLATVTAPIRELLKAEVAFYWDETIQGKAFSKVKDILSRAPVLGYFDNDKPVVLQCDASQHGLGACLMQEGKPVAYASRSLNTTECNYAQIEKELLAIVFGVEKFETYLFGRSFTVESDHKPLESIFKKSLLNAPKRLQRMLLRLQKFEFVLVYKKGSSMFMADALSRAYIPHLTKEVHDGEVFHVDVRTVTEKDVELINMSEDVRMTPETLEEIQQASETDTVMNQLKKIIVQGWPETKAEIQISVQDYFNIRDELTIQDGLVYKGDRIVIPTAMRGKIKERIQRSHLGIQGCLRRAREVVYWPRMNKEIEECISKCSVCREFSVKQQKEPLISQEIPDRPWQKVSMDLFETEGCDYLVIVDHYSDFFEVDKLSANKKASQVIGKIKAQFPRHGIPEEMFTDNGPPFNSKEFSEFAKEYGCMHVTSSPRYPQSNGKAESAVKIAQSIIKKAHRANTDPYIGLLDYYNTPTELVTTSPAQRMFSRRTRTLLPTARRLLTPEVVKDVKEQLYYRKEKQVKYCNRSTKELESLKPGDIVRI